MAWAAVHPGGLSEPLPAVVCIASPGRELWGAISTNRDSSGSPPPSRAGESTRSCTAWNSDMLPGTNAASSAAQVTVPEGTKPGATFEVEAEQMEFVEVAIPDAATPGMTLQVTMPSGQLLEVGAQRATRAASAPFRQRGRGWRRGRRGSGARLVRSARVAEVLRHKHR